jgi:hypothetical protein
MMRSVFLLLLAFGLGPLAQDQQAPPGSDEKNKKPALSVKATPTVSFSPARIRAFAELKGGPNDYQDFYCAAVEWDWGDMTQSESATDCEPYEEGKSEILRRFSSEHVYRMRGTFRVVIRLKRNGKVLTAANTTVTVRPGVRDGMY